MFSSLKKKKKRHPWVTQKSLAEDWNSECESVYSQLLEHTEDGLRPWQASRSILLTGHVEHCVLRKHPHCAIWSQSDYSFLSHALHQHLELFLPRWASLGVLLWFVCEGGSLTGSCIWNSKSSATGTVREWGECLKVRSQQQEDSQGWGPKGYVVLVVPYPHPQPLSSCFLVRTAM